MLERHYDGYINCPNCGKIIKENSAYCVHCNSKLVVASDSIIKNIKNNISFFFNAQHMISIIIFLIAVYFFTHRGFYLVTHMFPKVSSLEEERVEAPYRAVQKNLKPVKKIQIGEGKKKRELTLRAEYSLTGIVVAKNINFRFINRRDFDDIVPMDIGIVWGDIADVNYLKNYFSFVSETAWSARWLRTKVKGIEYTEEMNKFITHNHIIPATDNVASALLSLSKWDIAKIDGYLVDITHPDGTKSLTSLSRTDNNHDGRVDKNSGDGSGACEIIYVTGVQIGNRYYK